MIDDEYGRGVQLGEVVGTLKALDKKVEGLAAEMHSMQQTLASLTGGHKALLWIVSALGAIGGFLAELYSGALSRGHH